MSLRVRLFLVFGGLVALLVGAQWWWVRTLTADLSDELGDVAIHVGHQVADYFVTEQYVCPGGEECGHAQHDQHGQHENILIRRFETVRKEVDGEEPIILRVPPGRAVKLRSPDDALLVGDHADHDEESGVKVGAVVTPAEGDHQLFVAGDEDSVAYTLTVKAEEAKLIREPGDGSEEAAKAWAWLHKKPEVKVLALTGPKFIRHIAIPQTGFHDKLDLFSQRLLLGSAGLLGIGLLLAALVAHRVSAPLRRLSAAASRVGEGALGTQVEVNAGGEVGRAITAFNRMSRRVAELDARARALAARQHLGEIGEIARGLAHTLRNPLNALGLSVEELAARAGPEGEGGDLATAARRQIRRIDRAVRSLFVLASQGGGAIHDVGVAELAQDVALEALQDGRGRVRLEVDSGPDLEPLRAVEPELRAVLQALVVNAVEASPEGGTVTLRVRSAGAERLRVEVVDEGPGLPPEVRERLFTPHLTTKAGGSGMGLFLAYRIATTRYDGSLELEDGSDGGTRAVLTLGPRGNEVAGDE